MSISRDCCFCPPVSLLPEGGELPKHWLVWAPLISVASRPHPTTRGARLLRQDVGLEPSQGGDLARGEEASGWGAVVGGGIHQGKPSVHGRVLNSVNETTKERLRA